MFQNPTYEYIGGFSLASDICACAGTAQTADIASAHHSPPTTFHNLLFMLPSSLDLASFAFLGMLGSRQCTRTASWEPEYCRPELLTAKLTRR
jgi:hypothetical protein